MPELPDVETMRWYLQSTSLHQEIQAVEVHAPGVVRSDGGGDQSAVRELREELVGCSFASTRRHGKWLFVALDDHSERTLVLHFGMTGGLKTFKDMDDEPEYDRVLFRFANGYQLAYVSQRKLGQVRLIDDVAGFIDRRELGPDALDADLDLAAFRNLVEGRRVMAKALLMDQHTIAGIGNVYADEILFQAGVHPRTRVSALDDQTVERLFHRMKEVLRTAIRCQARPDRLPDTFLAPHRHAEGTCPACGARLERVKVSSRTAYYCPKCQRRAP
ncbi:MAG: DNA-formamidopyrimidine glycosylase family protein [Anaerolineae bacterium]